MTCESRNNLIEIDFTLEIADVDNDSRTVKRFEGKLMRAWPAVPYVKWRIRMSADMRTGSHTRKIDAGTVGDRSCPAT